MLEQPAIDEAALADSLRAEWGLPIRRATFLPLGADPNTAVYRAEAEDGRAYFLKLRRGPFDAVPVRLPAFLAGQGLDPVIPPLAARDGRLWARLGADTLILYPFMEGRDGYEAGLTDAQWVALGAALRRIHAAVPPPDLAGGIPRETWSPRWRDTLRAHLARIETEPPVDDVARRTAAFLRSNAGEISRLLERTGGLADDLRSRALPFVLCHADLHAWNVLIDPAGRLFIVDWDTAILAPRERDLMFPGAGLFGGRRSPREEETLFYQGYGAVQPDLAALAYYRYARVIEDLAVYCDALLLTAAGGEDREPSLRNLMANFQPGGTIALARAADPAR